jgi:hypothetical protein
MKHLLTTLAEIAEERNLSVLLIGGHAVAALGHPRATFDVDLLVPRSAASAWREELLKLNYRLFSESENFIQLEPTPDWPVPPLDLMLVDDPVFAALWESSVKDDPLPTPNALSMIALKLHARRQPGRSSSEKDWEDIIALIKAHDLPLDSPELQAILSKHADEGDITRLRDELGR